MIAKSSGTLIRNITEEVMGVSNAISNFLSLVVEIFVVVFIFIFILFIEPNGLLIISFFLLLGLYLFKKIMSKRLILWGNNRQKLFLKKISIINELFHSYPELKLLKKINYFGKLYINFNKEFFNNLIKFNIVQIIPRFLIESLAVLGMMCALIYLIIIENNQTQIIYSLAILGASALRLLPTTSRIVNYYNGFKFSAASINLIKSEIESLPYLEKKDMFQHLDDVVDALDDFTDTDYVTRIKVGKIHEKYDVGPDAIQIRLAEIVGHEEPIYKTFNKETGKNEPIDFESDAQELPRG